MDIQEQEEQEELFFIEGLPDDLSSAFVELDLPPDPDPYLLNPDSKNYNREIAGYVKRILNNDESLTEIDITCNLDADELQPLLDALNDNPEASKRIKSMTIAYNRYLSKIDLPKTLTGLEQLFLQDNNITEAKIPEDCKSLKYIMLDRNPVKLPHMLAIITTHGARDDCFLSFDYKCYRTVLTYESLNQYFKLCPVQVNLQDAVNNLKNIGAIKFLKEGLNFEDVMQYIYMLLPDMNSLISSRMSYLRDHFRDYNDQQKINTIDAYELDYNKMFYKKLLEEFDSLLSKRPSLNKPTPLAAKKKLQF